MLINVREAVLLRRLYSDRCDLSQVQIEMLETANKTIEEFRLNPEKFNKNGDQNGSNSD